MVIHHSEGSGRACGRELCGGSISGDWIVLWSDPAPPASTSYRGARMKVTLPPNVRARNPAKTPTSRLLLVDGKTAVQAVLGGKLGMKGMDRWTVGREGVSCRERAADAVGGGRGLREGPRSPAASGGSSRGRRCGV